MAAGDQVLPTTTVPNSFTDPPGAPSIGAVVDMGPTQGATERQFSLSGTSDNIVDVQDSQDGVSFFNVARLTGGARIVVPEIARFLRTVRQQGTAAVSCQVGDLLTPATDPAAFWDNGGNAAGPLLGGTLDGSFVLVGGLSVGSSTIVQSGNGPNCGVVIACGPGENPVDGQVFIFGLSSLDFRIGPADQFFADASGVVLNNAEASGPTTIFGTNVALSPGGVAPDFLGGSGVIFIAGDTVDPVAGGPAGGGILYVSGGALHYRGSGGTDTILGAS